MPFIPFAGGHSAAPITESVLRRAIMEGINRDAEERRRAGAAPRAMADALAFDYLAGAGGSDADKARLREQMRTVLKPRQKVGDAATVPEALTFNISPPVDQLVTPTVLLDTLPVGQLPSWTEVATMDFKSHNGTVQWGRGGDSSFPRVDYDIERQWLIKPELVWTSTSIYWRQSQQATSPNYVVDPRAEKAFAARQVMAINRENAILNPPSGVSFLGLNNVHALRGASSVVYGTAAAELVVQDMIRQINTIKEINRGAGAPLPDTIYTTQRVINGMTAKVVTSGAYPFNPMQIIRERLAEEGVNRIVIVPRLQDFGGSAVDAVIFANSGPLGLKRYQAMDFTPIRTLQVGLEDIQIYAAIDGGLFCPYPSATYIVEVEVTPITLN
jgi:hypothetical protein